MELNTAIKILRKWQENNRTLSDGDDGDFADFLRDKTEAIEVVLNKVTDNK
jgi:hypothetical protein